MNVGLILFTLIAVGAVGLALWRRTRYRNRIQPRCKPDLHGRLFSEGPVRQTTNLAARAHRLASLRRYYDRLNG